MTGAYRWWDGDAWTDWLSNSDDLDPPGEPGHSVRPDPLIGGRTRVALSVAGAVVAVLVLITAFLTWRGIQIVQATPPAATAPADPGSPEILAPEISAGFSEVSVRGLWGATRPSFPFSPTNVEDPSPVPVDGLFSAAAAGQLGSFEESDFDAGYFIGLVDPAVPGTTSKELADGFVEVAPGVLGGFGEAGAVSPDVGRRPGVRPGSEIVEFEIEVATPDRGSLLYRCLVQAEVWPDGTRTAWMSLVGTPVGAPEPADLADAQAALDESLASTE